MKSSRNSTWIEVNSQQAAYFVGVAAALLGIALLYQQVNVVAQLGEVNAAIFLALGLPGLSSLGVSAIFFGLGAIQGILQDIRDGQGDLSATLYKLLRRMEKANQQRAREVELLALEIDERDQE